MADFTALNAIVSQTQADATAVVAKVGVEDPTIQENINAATTAVTAIDNELKTKLP